MKRLFATDASKAALVHRVVLGLVIFPHGAQKLFGWFGGGGFSNTMGFFTESLGVPAVLALLVILAESLGSLALIAGVITRVAAFGISAVMMGAIVLVHWPYGFFMNWTGSQAGEGFEFHLLALALSVPLIFRGAGAFSVDRLLAKRWG